MKYTGQTSFAEMFEYYCNRNVTNEREYNERDMMRWVKQQLTSAHRQGWEQCQREAVGIAKEGHGGMRWSYNCAFRVSEAISSMEYKEVEK